MNAQSLRFSNGVRLSHSEASLATEKFCRDVAAGKLIINGMTVLFANADITIRGLSQKPASTLKILKGT